MTLCAQSRLVRGLHGESESSAQSQAAERFHALTSSLSNRPTVDASMSGPEAAKAAVFVQSEDYQGTRIKGPDFNQPHSLQDLLTSYERIGFQANGLARAIELIDKMVNQRHPPRQS